jgi:adenine-specific DNA-methyltransferase
MAKLEDLIKEIAEPSLRARVADEVAKLKAKKKFGLVFEEHIPETIRLPDLPFKTGVRIAQKVGRPGETFVVLGVNGDKVRVRPERGGAEESFSLKDIAPIKRGYLPLTIAC